jgi:multiple sugar transport system permease protein
MTASAGLAAAPPRAPAGRPTIRRRSRLARQAFPYLLVAPAVIYLLAITLYPGVFAIWQSFYLVRFNQWIPHGFQNYVDLFNDREFRAALWNTFVIGGIALAIEVALALLLAFHAYRDRWVRGWRILFLTPMLFMPSAVAFLWKLAFIDGRVVNDLLVRAGLVAAPVDWLANVWTARAVLIWTDVWQWTPFLFIIFVAALQGQDPEVEEAARLDGASWGQVFWSVSLPLIAPVVAVAVILRAIDIVTMFASVFIITAGTPGGATETVSYFVYRIGFRTFNFGYASAASVVLLAITVITAQTLVKRFFRSGRA